MNSANAIASSILGVVEWQIEEGFGYCRCPGIDLHHNSTGRRDTRIYLVGVPTITCFHSSCSGALEEANRKLRSAIGKLERGENPTLRKFEKNSDQAAREHEKAEAARLETLAENALPQILQAFPWPLENIWDASPESSDDVDDDWRRLLGLYDPADVVWIGDKFDSGKPEHEKHFRPAAEWLTISRCPPGPHVSPFAYVPGSFSRKAANILKRTFLVVESDCHSKDDQGAILRWLRDTAGLRLRAVIDAAGKSIHGWFDVPENGVLKELAAVLPALGCDPALLRPTQVSRLPSCRRGNKFQCLLYLDGRRAS